MTRFGAIVLTIVVALLMISCVVNSEAARTPPAITAVSPSSVAAGSADFTVAVSGSNFNTRSVVTVNGSPRATAYISQNQLAARILSGDVHQAGTIQLAISGLGTNSTSNAYAFSVTAPLALQIATSSLPNATVQAAYAASVASSGGLAPYNWKVASGQLPAGVALDSSSGILTGVPVQAGKYSFTAQVTDSSSTTQTASQPLNLDVMASSPLVMSSTTLPNGTVQVAYSASLSASGGTQPYTWSVTSGALPPGISLSSSTGALSGTPSQAGGFSFTVQVKDSAATPQTATNTFTITVAAPKLVISTTSLPQGTAGQPYSASLQASGGTPGYTWSVTSGSLPAGLSLASSGAISGTPSSAGSSTFTVQVKDSAATPQTATGTFTITMAAPAPAQLVISTTSLPQGTAGQSYAASLQASGGTPGYTWSVTSGSLPAGLSLASSGAISGTPSSAGSWTFTVQVKDSAATPQTATGTFTITIAASAPAQLVISTTSLPQGTAGQSYSASLQASGGTPGYTWSVTSGSLPAGLSLASSGAISGTPSSAGSSTFTVQVKDSAASAQTATASLALTIAPAAAPTISGVSPNAGPTSGGTLVTISGSSFKAGASVLFGATASPNVLVSGATQIQATTPALAAGTVSVSVKNPDGQTGTLASAFTFGQGLLITTSSLPNGTLNSSYSASLAAAGGSTPYTWSYSGTLPHCVALSSAGQLSGTPCVAGSYSFTTMVTDASVASATKLFDVIISGPVLAITTTSLPAPTQSTPYSAALQASGGATPYTWSVSSGQLPSGLTLDPSAGTISGTPTATGNFSFTAQVKDVASGQASASFTMSVAAPGVLTINSTSLPQATQNQTYSVTLQATGGTPGYTWSVTSGALPSGLSLMASSGQISGTPSVTGQFSFTVQVADSASPPYTASQAYTLSVSALPAFDQYGGLLSAPSPNGGTGFFRVEKNNGRWALITPDGNMTWYRGVQNADTNTINSAVLTNKYGGDVHSWGRDRNRRLTNWNFNILGEETACSEMPFGCYGGGASNSPKLSYLLLTPVSLDCVLNPSGVTINLPDYCKVISAGTVCSDCGAWKMIDPWDPIWQQGVANEFNFYVDNIIQNAVTQPWLVGWSLDDADYTQLFKAQGTGALTGGYAHAGFLIAVTKFQYTSAERVAAGQPAGNWLDPKLYGKYAWIDFLKARYPTISALNTAWGTGGFYTSFDDAGGFGVGTGVIDEDGRHTAWMGTSPRTLAGASAGVVTDLNAFLYQFTLKYSQVVVSTIRARDTNHLIFAPDFTSPYGEGMRSEVVRGFKDGGFNVLVLNYDPNFGPLAGNMVNNNAIYDLAQLPAILWYSVGAQADSGQSAFSVPYGDPNFATQQLRGQQVLNVDFPNFLNAAGTVYPDKYIIGIDWWVGDGTGDTFNWGLWSRLDNAYDGTEGVIASVPCVNGVTENLTNCGGQAANYGNFITSLKAANLLWTKVYP